MSRDYVTVKDTEGKYIFWDIDGTLASFRFNGHISSPDGSEFAMSRAEVADGLFLNREPSKFMQRVIAECKSKQDIIMGHSLSHREVSDKHLWLTKHYPTISERKLIPCDYSKADCIIEYCKLYQINLKDVMFVDDSVHILFEAERKGIPSYHISSFMDFFMRNEEE